MQAYGLAGGTRRGRGPSAETSVGVEYRGSVCVRTAAKVVAPVSRSLADRSVMGPREYRGAFRVHSPSSSGSVLFLLSYANVHSTRPRYYVDP